jgi:hypothetical protein
MRYHRSTSNSLTRTFWKCPSTLEVKTAAPCSMPAAHRRSISNPACTLNVEKSGDDGAPLHQEGCYRDVTFHKFTSNAMAVPTILYKWHTPSNRHLDEELYCGTS